MKLWSIPLISVNCCVCNRECNLRKVVAGSTNHTGQIATRAPIYLLPTQIRLIKQKCSTLSRRINSGLIILTGRSFNWGALRRARGQNLLCVVPRNRLISWLIWDHGEFNIRGSPRHGARTGGLTIMMRETETEKENSVTKASQGGTSGDVQSRMKTDMRRARKFTVGALPLVYAGYTLVECAGISEILTSRETSVVGKRTTRTIYTKEKFLRLKYFQSICTMIEAWRGYRRSTNEH